MKQYKKVATMTIWKNQGGKVVAGNNGWTPYVDGVPGDILLSKDKKYQISISVSYTHLTLPTNREV